MEPELSVAFFADADFFSGYKVSSDSGRLTNHEFCSLWKGSVLEMFTEQC